MTELTDPKDGEAREDMSFEELEALLNRQAQETVLWQKAGTRTYVRLGQTLGFLLAKPEFKQGGKWHRKEGKYLDERGVNRQLAWKAQELYELSQEDPGILDQPIMVALGYVDPQQDGNYFPDTQEPKEGEAKGDGKDKPLLTDRGTTFGSGKPKGKATQRKEKRISNRKKKAAAKKRGRGTRTNLTSAPRDPLGDSKTEAKKAPEYPPPTDAELEAAESYVASIRNYARAINVLRAFLGSHRPDLAAQLPELSEGGYAHEPEDEPNDTGLGILVLKDASPEESRPDKPDVPVGESAN